MFDNNVQHKKFTNDNNKISESSEDNGVQDLSKISSDDNNEQFKELPSSENNNSQDLSQTNLIVNHEQINPDQENIENGVNCDITLSKVFDLITELQKSLTVQIKDVQEQNKDIQDKQQWIIKKINELSNDVKKPLPNNQQRTISKKSRSNKYEPPIIPVEYLEEHGKDELHKKLETMTDDQLKEMNRLFLNKQRKELDKIVRKQMIQDLINYAEAELKRGDTYLKDR